MNGMRTGWMRAMLMAVLMLGPAGCQRFFVGEQPVPNEPQPPSYVQIVGQGSAAPEKTTTSTMVFGGVFSGPVRAEAAAALDGQIADPAQRVLMAQAEARRKALRMLGSMILKQRDSQGAVLGEELKKNPTTQSRLNTLLEERAQVTFSETAQGVRATAVVDGKAVTEALGLTGPQAGMAAAGGASLQARKEASYNLALSDAKAKLDRTLREIKLPDGQTAGQALENNPDAKLDWDAMLWVVQPDETKYNPDGSCEVTIYFDRNRVPEIFKTRAPWWMFWKR